MYGDGRFKFVPIPERPKYVSGNSWTYGALGLGEILPTNWKWGNYAHYDPEFLTFTWGDYENKRTYQARQLKARDFYFFISSLQYHLMSGVERAPDIDPDWGYYIIGFFKAAQLPVWIHYPIPKQTLARFPNNAHVRRREGSWDPFLVFTGTAQGEAGSRLLGRAVPLSNGVLPNRLAKEAMGDWLRPSPSGSWNKRWWEEGVVSEAGVKLLLEAAGVDP